MPSLGSITDAVTSAVPLIGTDVLLIVSVIVEPVGETSDIFSQPHIVAKAAARASTEAQIRDTESPVNYNRCMKLAGQGLFGAPARRLDGSSGYAMAALLVGMSVMAVIMGALLPVWTQMATREKEAELVFRGNQYVRAIGLFQRKFANTNPPTIDLLVEQRFLRKKFKDPITNDDFQPIYASQAMQGGVSAPAGAQRPGQQATASLGTPAKPTVQAGFGSTGATSAGGIIGVTSKSKEPSIKIYNGRDKYNEWAFVYIQTVQRPGGPGAVTPGQGRPGQGGPAGPGGPGRLGGPGQGQPPGMGGPGGSQPSRPPVGLPSPFGPGQMPQPNVRPPGQK